jgi:hypothetical protein
MNNENINDVKNFENLNCIIFAYVDNIVVIDEQSNFC